MNERAEPPPRADDADRVPPPNDEQPAPRTEPVRRSARKWRAIGCGATLLLVIVMGGASFLAASFIVSAVRGQAELKRANQLVWSRQFADAVPLYSASLGEHLLKSDHALAYGNRGWAYTNLDRDPEAIKDFTAALAIEPNLVFALLDRGLAFHRQGKFDEAQADYDKVIALAPNTLDAYRNRSMILAHLGRLKEAIADMDEAVRCDPNNAVWFALRGYYYLRDNNLEAALASYESALRIDPENEQSYWGRAAIFARRHEPERGVAEVSEAIRRHPDSARLHYARGLVQMELLEPEKALDDFNAAILLRPNFAVAYSERGAVETWLRRFGAALDDVLRAIGLDARLSTPHYVRGRAYRTQHKYKEAIAEFDRAIGRDSENVWAVSERALTEAYAGDYELARRNLEEATRKFPGTYQAHLSRAWFLATCPQAAFRNGATALTEAQLAVRLSSEDPYALDTLASAYAEAGDFDKAQEEEGKALAKMPALAPDRREIEARLAGFNQRQPYRDYP